MRVAVFIALLAAAQCGAQDLPDPGRRLSQEEQKADAEKPPGRVTEPRPVNRPRNAKACESARVHYQLSCGTPQSPRSRSMQCAEAYALYRQSCD